MVFVIYFILSVGGYMRLYKSLAISLVSLSLFSVGVSSYVGVASADSLHNISEKSTYTELLSSEIVTKANQFITFNKVNNEYVVSNSLMTGLDYQDFLAVKNQVSNTNNKISLALSSGDALVSAVDSDSNNVALNYNLNTSDYNYAIGVLYGNYGWQ